MPVAAWAEDYVGLPFCEHGRARSGLDCWGLVRLVHAEQFGHALPSYAECYARTTQQDVLGALIARESGAWWQDVPKGQEQCGDVIVLRVRGAPMHVGVVLGEQHMLHIELGIDSVIEKYTGSRWVHRVYGFYRYVPSPA